MSIDSNGNGEFAVKTTGVRPWTQLIRLVRGPSISGPDVAMKMKRKGPRTAGNQMDVCSVNICLFSFVGRADLSDN